MENILPDLQACLLCEDVRNEVNGQQSLVGILAAIPAPQVPVGFFKLCVWSRWCGGMGNFLQQTYLLNAVDEKPIATAEVRFALQSMESNATNVNFFGGLQFPQYGVYHVEVHLEGELRLRFPFSVVPVNRATPSNN